MYCDIEDNCIGPILLSVLDTYLFDVEALEILKLRKSVYLFEKQMSEENILAKWKKVTTKGQETEMWDERKL